MKKETLHEAMSIHNKLVSLKRELTHVEDWVHEHCYLISSDEARKKIFKLISEDIQQQINELQSKFDEL